jgi:tRNA pseudouridine synthase 10
MSAAAAEVVPAESMRPAAVKASQRGLCAECFGRLFGRWGHGLTNPQRAEQLSAALGLPKTPPSSSKCSLCTGLFDRLDVWTDRAVRAVDGLEWHRFTCGSRWNPEILAHEEMIWQEVGATHPESIRGAFNREWGKRIEGRTGTEGGTSRADLVFLADLPTGRVEVTILPVFFRGRYRKLDRTLPQTHWPCRRCHGRGCTHCQGTGKTYPTSVEEIVAAPFLRACGGTTSRFHGMGREDIDARMLGEGRPFVLELLRPQLRSLSLPPILAELAQEAQGRVEVLEVESCGPEEVLRVKSAAPDKSYRIEVRGTPPEEKINEALRVAVSRAIAQRTPTRVAHRRSDRVRTRRIVAAQLVGVADGRFTLEIRTEAGTYVKEWVEGDGGRTEPSLAELLGTPLSVDSLDVIAVHDRGD